MGEVPSELTGSFTVNREDVAAKVIDGELIIIRLSDGTYYSMEDVGANVWELIGHGYTAPDICRTIASWYDVEEPNVVADVDRLIRELIDERLILPAERESEAADGASPPDRADYETPILHIYRDMGNLLALDPPTPGIDDLVMKDHPG